MTSEPATRPAAAAPWWRRVRHRLLVADPGLQRTYLAGRVTLAVAVALVVAFPLGDALALPATVGMLAVSVAMAVAAGIVGPTVAAQLRSAGFVWLVASASTAAGAALAAHTPAGQVGIVAAMAAGVWLTRRGVQWIGVGMAAFMPYVFTLFTRATIGQLPWLLAAVALGVAIPLLVRSVLLRDPPERRLARLLVALRARTEALAAHGANGGAAPADARGGASRLAVRVDEVVLQLQELLDQHDGLVGEERRFRRHLFAVATLSHLLALRAEPDAERWSAALASPATDPADRLAWHLAALDARCRTGAGSAGEPPADARDDAADESLDVATATHAVPPRPVARPRLDPPARAALQVAVAGAVAAAVGVLVSPERWFWVPMSAFFVFVNTTSRGATLRRAAERTIGTAAGVAGGLVAGYLLAGTRGLEVALLFPLIFAGYWLLQVSYAATITSVTILLVLVLDLMGVLTPELLVARIVDTGIGAAIGAASAYLVLPARTRGVLDDAFRGYFAALDELLAALADAGARDRRVLGSVGALDRATGALRKAVDAVAAAIPGQRSRALRQELMLALTARFWVHRTAARLVFHPGEVDDGDVQACVTRVRDRLARLREGARATDASAERAACRGADVAALVRAEAVLAQLERARAAEERAG